MIEKIISFYSEFNSHHEMASYCTQYFQEQSKLYFGKMFRPLKHD